jgi:hypothetical protein
MFSTFVQKSKSNSYTRIMLLTHSTIILFIFSRMPFCCGEYGVLVYCWIPHSFQEGIKHFGNIFFDLHARFVFHQHIIYFEYFKHLSFGFQRLKKCIFYECEKISCSTMDYLKPTYLGLNLHSYLPI